jgi:hypothetical protein
MMIKTFVVLIFIHNFIDENFAIRKKTKTKMKSVREGENKK